MRPPLPVIAPAATPPPPGQQTPHGEADAFLPFGLVSNEPLVEPLLYGHAKCLDVAAPLRTIPDVELHRQDAVRTAWDSRYIPSTRGDPRVGVKRGKRLLVALSLDDQRVGQTVIGHGVLDDVLP